MLDPFVHKVMPGTAIEALAAGRREGNAFGVGAALACLALVAHTQGDRARAVGLVAEQQRRGALEGVAVLVGVGGDRRDARQPEVDHLPAAVGQQLVRARPALLQDERMVTLLALVDDLGVRRDRAPPRLEPGKARQLILVQRKEPVQLLDQSARDRCHRFIVPRPRACEPQTSNKDRRRRRLLL